MNTTFLKEQDHILIVDLDNLIAVNDVLGFIMGVLILIVYFIFSIGYLTWLIIQITKDCFEAEIKLWKAILIAILFQLSFVFLYFASSFWMVEATVEATI